PTSVEELRKFGFIFAGILIFLFGLLLPYLKHHEIRVWPFYIGMPVALLATVRPAGLRPLYVVWMKFGEVMGFINTRIIMSIFFFVLLTPIAWLMKALGKDPLARTLEKSVNSYRVTSKPYAKDEMEKPY
ncbi:MAG TPA: SxtJ family membrane protein, partial [Spongiibacteraceae bacterium]|nr:SxtJ family membrane protein [Spongiibacteraceae bacterium]